MSQQFPESFLFGASTAAHQVEGNNIHSDFWQMEQLKTSSFVEPSGEAVDHYHRYREDIAMLAGLGLNAYRFSIEWARIEPKEGVYDKEAIRHYQHVLKTCHEYNITPIVTLHHFSSPFWLIREGGWESEETPARFARYCAYIMQEMGDLIPYVCTINEGNIAVGIAKAMKNYTASSAQVGLNMDMVSRMKSYYEELGRIFSLDPRDVHTFLAPRSEHGLRVIMHSHEQARAAIRQVSPDTRIGITLSLHDFQSIPGGEEGAAHAWEEEFLQFLPSLKEDDFFGLQNYTREIHGHEGVMPVAKDVEITQMGYEFYPQGLESVIRFAFKHLDKPIIVTENGIATDKDDRRIAFTDIALKGVLRCISDGIPVKGYMHWSLLDNFEWQLGYSRTFGLIAVDRTNQKRFPKPSAYHLGQIAQSRTLPSYHSY
jgi:beta-glucosidase